MAKVLTMTIGLPGSGKSSWALEEVKRSKGSTKRVNKDSLRLMVDGGQWSKAREKFIVAARNVLVAQALADGFSVIVDDTNLTPDHEIALRQIANEHGASFVIKDFRHVPLETCLKQDAMRQTYVGEKVIREMWMKHIRVKPAPMPYDPAKWDCVIVDMDGTLCDLNGRNPYDASTADKDLPRDFVISLLNCIRMTRVLVIFVLSGREEKYREPSERWLNQHLPSYKSLHMRATGDTRKDSAIKEELYYEHIHPGHNVRWVIDDRPQVVRMWRGLGLPVLDVGEGIEF